MYKPGITLLYSLHRPRSSNVSEIFLPTLIFIKMLILYIILCSLLLSYVNAQNPASFFVEPPASGQAQLYYDDRGYTVGSTLPVKWVTNEQYYQVSHLHFEQPLADHQCPRSKIARHR